jgi:hypothetical protein
MQRSPMFMMGTINIVKMTIWMKWYKFNAIPTKIAMIVFIKIEETILKFLWKHKRSWISKAILSKKSNAGGNTVPNFKLYYRAKATKSTWYWHKNRHIGQWNGIEDAKISPSKYGQLILDKVTKNIYRGKKDSFFNNICWESQISAYARPKLDPYLSPCTKNNSKWIKDLIVITETWNY